MLIILVVENERRCDNRAPLQRQSCDFAQPPPPRSVRLGCGHHDSVEEMIAPAHLLQWRRWRSSWSWPGGRGQARVTAPHCSRRRGGDQPGAPQRCHCRERLSPQSGCAPYPPRGSISVYYQTPLSHTPSCAFIGRVISFGLLTTCGDLAGMACMRLPPVPPSPDSPTRVADARAAGLCRGRDQRAADLSLPPPCVCGIPSWSLHHPPP